MINIYHDFFKFLIDFIFSIIGFLILLPIFILTTLLLAIVNKGNPFFLQKRPGKSGKIFSIIKFKTMTDKKDAFGVLLPDSERITRMGTLIRKSSLDEIPQLLNVIKGDMSLVGPRPLLIEYLDLYNSFQKRRHNVKPGITGWAQVNGRNAISWEEKFKYDVWYVENLSFGLDCKIILMTFLKVLRVQGINQEGNASMEKFSGN